MYTTRCLFTLLQRSLQSGCPHKIARSFSSSSSSRMMTAGHFQHSMPRYSKKDEPTTTSAAVPIVDMALSLNQVGRQIPQACSTTGFFYLANHDNIVPQHLCDAVLAQARGMFDTLTEQEKDAISVAHSNSYRGYQRLGVNVTSEQRDGHEALDLSSESKAALRHGGDNGLTNYGHNLWPDSQRLPLLRPFVQTYIEKMTLLGKQMTNAMALGLELEPHIFRPYFNDAYWTMRLIRYPAANDKSDFKYDFGVGEHSDYGVFTMILCDDVPHTLQIRPKGSTTWQWVDPIAGAFICNIGDMLARWTNNIYVSTPHRVLPPQGQDRISVPFFFDPNYSAHIAPIDALVQQSGRPPCFEPIMYGDHLLAKTSKNFVL